MLKSALKCVRNMRSMAIGLVVIAVWPVSSVHALTTDEVRKNSAVEIVGGNPFVRVAYFDNSAVSWDDAKNGISFMAREYSEFLHASGSVTTLQERLNLLLPLIDPAFTLLTVDGVYSTRTRTAVEKFRAWYAANGGGGIDDPAFQRLATYLSLDDPSQIFGSSSVFAIEHSHVSLNIIDPANSLSQLWSKPILRAQTVAVELESMPGCISHPIHIASSATLLSGMNADAIQNGTTASGRNLYKNVPITATSFIPASADGISEYAVFETTDPADGNAFQSWATSTGYVSRGYATLSVPANAGTVAGAAPIASRETIIAAGVEELHVSTPQGTKINRYGLIENSADVLYYSGHGYPDHLGIGFTMTDATTYWTGNDLDLVILAACSIVNPGTCVQWKSTGISYVLGYHDASPLDSTGIPVTTFNRWTQLRSTYNDAEAWVHAARQMEGAFTNAAAIDSTGSKYWYINIFGAVKYDTF